MTAQGFDNIEVEKIESGRYRIVLVGDGLTIDAMLVGVGADAIAQALSAGGNPAALLREYRAKAAAKRGGRFNGIR
jgi:hypothetical protein